MIMNGDFDPFVVVSDYDMPHMNGEQLAKILGKERPEIRIVFVAGQPQEVFDRLMGLDNVDGTLPKPFDIKDLRSVVIEALQKAASLRQGQLGLDLGKQLPRDCLSDNSDEEESISSPVEDEFKRKLFKRKGLRSSDTNYSSAIAALFFDKGNTLLPEDQEIEPPMLKYVIDNLEAGIEVAIVTADSKYSAVKKELISPLVLGLRSQHSMDLLRNFHLVHARKIKTDEGTLKRFDQYRRFVPTKTGESYRVISKLLGRSADAVVSDKGKAIELLIEELSISCGTVIVATDASKDEAMFKARLPEGVTPVNVYVGEENVDRLIKRGVIVSPSGLRLCSATERILANTVRFRLKRYGYGRIISEMFDTPSSSLANTSSPIKSDDLRRGSIKQNVLLSWLAIAIIVFLIAIFIIFLKNEEGQEQHPLPLELFDEDQPAPVIGDEVEKQNKQEIETIKPTLEAGKAAQDPGGMFEYVRDLLAEIQYGFLQQDLAQILF